jgi:lysophospholipase L1-like esterase
MTNTNNVTPSRRKFLTNITLAGMAMAGTSVTQIYAAAPKYHKKEDLRKGMVFLFQGDSITDGNRGRTADPNHIMGHGYAFSVASRLGADYPEKELMFYNRGISGNKVDDLAARWQKDTLDLKPDVLSILIGVNDVNGALSNKGATLEQFENVYASILDRTLAEFPKIIFVLCHPFVLPVGGVKGKIDLWNKEIQDRQVIVEKLALRYNAVLVDFQKVMTMACLKAPAAYWMWDGIHPSVPGHELLAREWMLQVGKRIRF